jgi:hypothetical protein
MLTIFDSIRKEFSVNDKGITYTSKRGLSRLCGVQSNTWSKKLFLFSKELDLFICEELGIDCSVHQNNVNSRDFLLKVLSDKGFLVVTKSSFEVQDILASLIIEFYATVKKVQQARETNRALRAIGLRTAIQQTTGWKKPEVDYSLFVLPTPMTWVKRFPDELYDEFSRLTGLTWDKKTHQTPHYFAKLTYLFVYKYLPREVYDKIKASQGLIEQNIKVHQFLNEDALFMLNEHLKMVVTVLECATTIKEAKRFLNQRITKQYQLNLFS